jgi:hypothetical protein
MNVVKFLPLNLVETSPYGRHILVVKFNLWKEINKLCIYDIEVQELIKVSILENDAWESTL